MAKKFLCAVVLMFSLACLLASCDNGNDTTPSTPQSPTHTHNYGEWETIQSATCTAEGIKERYCACGEKQSTTISVIAHSYGEWETIKEATYSEKGTESRKCTCGKTETRDIAKKESETKMLTGLECWNELFNYYSNMLEESSISYKEGDDECSIYNDGVNTIIYSYYEKLDGDTLEKRESWYGKYGNHYVYVYRGNGEQYYEIISKEDYDSALENYRSNILDPIEDLLGGIADSDAVECVMTTGETNTYVIKVSTPYDTVRVIVKAKDGLITEYQYYDVPIVYSTDVMATIPNLSDWEQR